MHIPKIYKKGVCIFMEDKKFKEINKHEILEKEKKLNENLEQKYEVGEDSKKYGEFISSYFAWISLPNQKERAEELDKMTKNSENKN